MIVCRSFIDARQLIDFMTMETVFLSFFQMEVAACCILGVGLHASCVLLAAGHCLSYFCVAFSGRGSCRTSS